LFDPSQMGPMAPPPMPEMAPPQAAPQDAGTPGITDPRYKEALAILEEVMRSEPDDQDSSALAGLLKDLYKLIADRQKETDDMMQGKLSQRALRRP
jgi:hypothetical protein